MCGEKQRLLFLAKMRFAMPVRRDSELASAMPREPYVPNKKKNKRGHRISSAPLEIINHKTILEEEDAKVKPSFASQE